MANEQRLIDAKQAIAEINRVETKHPYDDKEDIIEKCVNILNTATTVDAVEVVHAHWEDGCAIHNGKEVYKSIDCSHCNEMFKTEDREYWKKRFKVCPFCGAVMDGERREGE